MSNIQLEDKLKELKIEDFIWLVYIGIIFLSWYSNSLERKYFVFNDQISKEKYRKIIILIFSVLVVVYLYFFIDSYNALKNLKPCATDKQIFLTHLSVIGSFLILISGLIFLYIAIEDKDLNVEIAFN